MLQFVRIAAGTDKGFHVILDFCQHVSTTTTKITFTWFV
jgi:hypothetical protein